MNIQSKKDDPFETSRTPGIKGDAQNPAIFLERDAMMDWVIDFELMGEKHRLVLEGGRDPDSEYAKEEYVFYPAGRALVVLSENGLHFALTGILTLRQDWDGSSYETSTWSVDCGPIPRISKPAEPGA